MLKRKAQYDAKHKTPRPASSHPSTTLPPPNPPASSNKKQKLSLEDKTAHRDPSLYLNKQRTLVLSSRGISYLHRHLLSDVVDLLPHGKKEHKLDTKNDLDVLNELALLKSCNNVLFFESRKHTDLYLWCSRAGVGPSVKFHVQNVHTMAEVKMTGNCMKHSRPLLIFDAAFDSAPHLQLIKALLHTALGAPKGHPKVKPFVDHVLSFFHVDERVWVRHYQIVYNSATHIDVQPNAPTPSPTAPPAIQLVEIGPRLVLCPIRVFSGSMGGATLWENEHYVSPNALRAQMKAARGREYSNRQRGTEKTRAHKEEARMEENEVDTVFAAKAQQ